MWNFATWRFTVYPQLSQMRMVSSPTGVRYMNSWAMLPPMMPTSAPTAMAGSPHRTKILKYAL